MIVTRTLWAGLRGDTLEICAVIHSKRQAYLGTDPDSVVGVARVVGAGERGTPSCRGSFCRDR
jgi:hypothetical protein